MFRTPSVAPAATRGWGALQQPAGLQWVCQCCHRSLCCSSSSSRVMRGFSTDARVRYLNSSSRRRSVVHAATDLPPLFVIPRLRQQQPLLHALPSSSSSSSEKAYIPSPLSIHLKHLIERRRAARRSKHHPLPLPLPSVPAAAPPRQVANALPPLPVSAAVAAAAVGQQQLEQQQLLLLQNAQLLQLRGGAPAEGLGLAGADVVSLSGDAAAADAVSPLFAAAESLEAVAAAALARWRETAAATAATAATTAAAAERDDKAFWDALCDRLNTSRDVLPVSTLAALLRLICCRYAPTACAAEPYFLQHFAAEGKQQPQLQQQQQLLPLQRLPSQRPLRSGLLQSLAREFIDDMHCLSAASAADVAAAFAASNCCSLELLQLLIRRSIDSWMQSEQQLQQQQQQQQQQRQQQHLFAFKPEALSCFSPQQFCVFCSALQHLLQQLQPLLLRRAQHKQQQQQGQLIPVAEFISSAAAFLLRCSKEMDVCQQHAALASLAALAADGLQQQQQQQQQQLVEACRVLLSAADASLSLTATTAAAAAATAAVSCMETARLMSLLPALAAVDDSALPKQQQQQQQQRQQQQQQEQQQDGSAAARDGAAASQEDAASLQQQPGAAALLVLLQQTEKHLLLLQEQVAAPAAAQPAAAAAAVDRMHYASLQPHEFPSATALQQMACVSKATAAAGRILLQPLLLHQLQQQGQQQERQKQRQRMLQQLLQQTEGLSVRAAPAAAPLLQAAANRVASAAVSLVAARMASLLPRAADAADFFVLLAAAEGTELRRHPDSAAALQALSAELARRFAELTVLEKATLRLAVSLSRVEDPVLRHYVRTYGRPLQQRIAAAARSSTNSLRSSLAAAAAASAVEQ